MSNAQLSCNPNGTAGARSVGLASTAVRRFESAYLGPSSTSVFAAASLTSLAARQYAPLPSAQPVPSARTINSFPGYAMQGATHGPSRGLYAPQYDVSRDAFGMVLVPNGLNGMAQRTRMDMPQAWKTTKSSSVCKEVSRSGVKKGRVGRRHWTRAEDACLKMRVGQLGQKCWALVAQTLAGRNHKQCWERWHYHLDPNINKLRFTEEEDSLLVHAQAEIGNRWTEIATRFLGRTANAVKNRWYSASFRKYTEAIKARERSGLVRSRPGAATASGTENEEAEEEPVAKKVKKHNPHYVAFGAVFAEPGAAKTPAFVAAAPATFVETSFATSFAASPAPLAATLAGVCVFYRYSLNESC